MNITQLKQIIDNYNNCITERSWIKSTIMITYENEYLKVKSIDTSNKHIGQNEMSKMWSIIFESKKDFRYLPNFKLLVQNLNVAVTPVKSGKNAGYYGIRIYDMKRDPDRDIIQLILDFIFA